MKKIVIVLSFLTSITLIAADSVLVHDSSETTLETSQNLEPQASLSDEQILNTFLILHFKSSSNLMFGEVNGTFVMGMCVTKLIDTKQQNGDGMAINLQASISHGTAVLNAHGEAGESALFKTCIALSATLPLNDEEGTFIERSHRENQTYEYAGIARVPQTLSFYPQTMSKKFFCHPLWDQNFYAFVIFRR